MANNTVFTGDVFEFLDRKLEEKIARQRKIQKQLRAATEAGGTLKGGEIHIHIDTLEVRRIS